VGIYSANEVWAAASPARASIEAPVGGREKDGQTSGLQWGLEGQIRASNCGRPSLAVAGRATEAATAQGKSRMPGF
jgi:hypothetical protein